MKKFLLVVLFSYGLYADSITTSEASNYIGEEKTVCGEVVSTYYSKYKEGSPTFLNLDSFEKFKVVIFKENRKNFSSAPEYIYINRNICVTGMIENFDDSLQVVVSSEFQIK